MSVPTSEVKLVEFVQRAGLLKGLESGTSFIGTVGESLSNCTGDGCVLFFVAVLPVLVPLTLLGAVVSTGKAASEETVVYRPEPICAESVGFRKVDRVRRMMR